MSLIYGNKINDPAFEPALDAVASQLQTDPNNLMLVFQLESGVNPAAQNLTFPIQGGYATGLMQFAPNTMAQWGITGDQMKALSATDQLQYVLQYFTPYIGKIGTFEDLYLVTFFPAALGYTDDQCIGNAQVSCAQVAASNPGYDLNKDGQITVGEFKQAIDAKIPFGYGSQTSRSISAALDPVISFLSPAVNMFTTSPSATPTGAIDNTDSPVAATGLFLIIVITFLVVILLLFRKYLYAPK